MWRNLTIALLSLILLGLACVISVRLAENESTARQRRSELLKGLRPEPSPVAKATVKKAESSATPEIRAEDSELEPLVDGLRLLIQGRIVDDLGAALPDLLVRVEGDALVAPHQIRMAERGSRSDSLGRFRIMGRDHQEFSLLIESATDPEFRHRLDGLRPRPEQQLIRLTRPAALEGQLRAAPDFNFDWLEVCLQDPGGNWLARSFVEANGRFQMTNLPAGLFDLEVCLLGAEEPLLSLRGLKLAPGEDCRDPRLAMMTIRETFSACWLQVVGPGNVGIPGADVIVLMGSNLDGTPRFRSFKTDHSGNLQLPIVALGHDLEVSHPDYQLGRTWMDSSSETLVLSPAESISLDLTTPAFGLRPDQQLELQFRYDQNRRLGSESLCALRVPNQTLAIDQLPSQQQFQLRAAGKYEVEVRLVSRDDPKMKEVVGAVWLQLNHRSSNKQFPLQSVEAALTRASERLESRRRALR